MNTHLEFVIEKERQHVSWRRTCLNMVASENVASPSVRKRLSSDFQNRYVNIYGPTLSSGWKAYNEKRWYEGLDYIEEVERRCVRLLQELFHATYADYRPLSGNVANLDCFVSLTKIGDIIFTKSTEHGGHGEGWDDAAVLLGRRIERYPFNEKDFVIDVDKASRKIKEIRPRLIVLGASQILFPEPVEELKKAADEVGAAIDFDGSHVLGLIAGHRFQDPLEEGATVLSASTHKTFPGPQGGVLLSNASEEITSVLDVNLDPSLIDNYHQNRMAALTVASAEMIEFGNDYALQVLSNAKALAQALHEEGFNVLCEHRGFTESHQVLVNVTAHGLTGTEAAKLLAKNNLIVSACSLPGDAQKGIKSGIRFGTSETTRVGMKPSDMNYAAELFRRALIDKDRADSVRADVKEFTKRFQKIYYSFDEGKIAYEVEQQG
ncbi:MAG: serine hydroxymethyltransferase [Candidatus Bathyarchaeia archaeon]